MPYVNKTSLRDEFERIKSDFNRLSDEKKLSSEVSMLMQSMILLFEVVVAAFLEKKTKKSDKNSSKPPSQTDKDESSTQEGSNGKGKKENDSLSDNTRTRETVKVARVNSCNHCGEDLEQQPCDETERRTKIDIIFEKVVCHVDAEIKRCPTCNTKNKGRFPEEMSGPIQYGSGIKAYILSLLMGQMLSLKRIQNSIKTLIGCVISESTILKYVLLLNLALKRWEEESLQKILTMPAIHVDETGFRVDKKNNWMHVYSAGDITLKFLHEKRGSQAIEDIGIIPKYGGNIIHDCWASYLSYDHCGHGLCGSHLLRELTFIVESNGYAWAKNMKALLQSTCKKVSRRKRKKLTPTEYANLQKHYRNLLTRGERELPPIPERAAGKRGKVAKTDAHNLWERLKKYEDAVLVFAKKSEVSFTNNRAERDLRMSKVKQKISGCFRTTKYASAYCRISSYLQTMANKGYNPLVAIQMAFSGQIYNSEG